MNSIERIRAAISFEPVDRVPVIAQVFGYTAVSAGISILDYVQSGKHLAESQVKALARYGYDAVFAISDANIETEALGSKLKYRLNNYPFVEVPAFSKKTNLNAIPVPDPYSAGRMPQILEALKIMHRELANEVLIVGGVMGPMTLATQLLGIEAALYLAIDDPESFNAVLEFSTRVAIQFGIAQIECGAHLPLVFEPSASTAVIPAAFFREFVLPKLQKVFAAFKTAGAAAGWLHVAGPIAPILPLCARTGAGILNIDYCVDTGEAMELAPSSCLDGNIKSLDFEEATPEEIFSEALRLQDRFAPRGGFILSSGCEIPPGSKHENVDALVAATRNRR